MLLDRRTAVFRVKRHQWLDPRMGRWLGSGSRRAVCPLVGGALLLSVCASGGAALARPATTGPGPLQTLPPTEAVPEPGAAVLLEGEPLQLGLREQGLPTPMVPPAAAPGAGTPQAPAGVQPPAGTPAPPSSRRLVLDRRHKVLRVFDGSREMRRYPVAVGMPGWETPVGEFAVIEKRANPTWEHPASGVLLRPGPDNPLGSRWIGFYTDCRGRSGFNGQEHLVVKGCVTAGFHGTPNRRSVGRAVSHGCVRLFDEHAKELFDLVSLGTPVTVLP